MFISNFKQNKKYLIIGGIIALLGVVFLLFVTRQSGVKPLEEMKETKAPLVKSQSEEPKKETKSKTVIIDIKGAVAKPGVYEIAADGRIKDAVRKAGGLSAEADPTALNQAEKLKDEMAVYVAKIGETSKEKSGTIKEERSETAKVNLNKATAKDLEKVPGIGATKAKTIVSYREKEGLFQSIDDLQNVSGIGPKTVGKLKEHLEI